MERWCGEIKFRSGGQVVDAAHLEQLGEQESCGGGRAKEKLGFGLSLSKTELSLFLRKREPFSDCANMEDYYTTLGLTKSASIADVTSSFRKLALKVRQMRCNSRHAAVCSD